jgi:hypothetical protein
MNMDLDSELSASARQKILSNELTAVLTKLDHSFSTVMEDVVEHLFAKAESSGSNREAQVFLDAYNNVRNQRLEIEQRFKKTFRSLLDDSISNKPRGITAAEDASWSELSLVDTNQIEEDVQVRQLCDKIKASVEWELRDLNVRMSYLLGRDDAQEEDNPLRPELFCRAVGKVCAELESDHQVRLAVLRSFENALSQNLGTVYHDLNTRLISHRVLPKVRHHAGMRRTSPEKVRGKDVRGYESSQVDATRMAGERIEEAVENVVESTLSMFDALQRLVGNSSAYKGTFSSVGESGSAGHSRRNLMKAIQGLREAHEMALDLPLLSAFGSKQVGTSDRQEVPVEFAQQLMPNFIWANREQLSAAATNNIDRMKIDIVAMLFDQILADEKLPAEFKMLLGRLQLPVLRIALADGTFFATRAHPARRLIDRIASCAVGYEKAGDASHRFVAEVERIVLALLQNVDEDSALYESLLTEFEQFLEGEHAQSNDIVGRAVGVLERAEVREVLGINATIQVNQLLYGVTLDPFLRAFLLDVWTHVLVEAACHCEDTKTDATVARYKQLCADLVWSAQPKVTPEDRRRLVALLPKMIGCIREGLALIGYPSEQETRFFAELMQIHSAAVRASGAGTQEPIDIDQFANRLRDMVVERDVNALPPTPEAKLSEQAQRRVVAESRGEVEFVDVTTEDGNVASVDLLQPSDETIVAWVQHLQRGNWYELRVDNVYVKVRLAWISPLKSFYLFVPATGLRAHSLHPDALRKSLKIGDLRFIEDELLVDRAVRSVMYNLEHEKEAAEAVC